MTHHLPLSTQRQHYSHSDSSSSLSPRGPNKLIGMRTRIFVALSIRLNSAPVPLTGKCEQDRLRRCFRFQVASGTQRCLYCPQIETIDRISIDCCIQTREIGTRRWPRPLTGDWAFANGGHRDTSFSWVVCVFARNLVIYFPFLSVRAPARGTVAPLLKSRPV